MAPETVVARAVRPTAFRADVRKTLDALGIDDIDPRADLDTFCAAAALCEAAGRVVLPYPVAMMAATPCPS